MRTVGWALVLAGALVTGAPTAARAAVHTAAGDRAYDMGTISSSSGHVGRATARVWISSFSEKHFQVYGSLHDRDRHPGHCASIRARFHYLGGGTGWSPARRHCASYGKGRAGYLFESRSAIRRVDVRICVADGLRGPTSYCRTLTVRDEDVAW
uniref:hypothetical protein n=1 Tax=Nonomuraea pusilla TaxID=46177 RepID=UPI0006E3EFCC|nr:hypothetical protein [Nonomuraea pusilla]